MEHRLTIGGHQLVAQQLAPGCGLPIILLHGVTLSNAAWHASTFLRRGGPVFALSLPGHWPAMTNPSFNGADLAPARLAQILQAAIQQLVGEQPVLVVGHSTGGYAALCLARYAPSHVAAVITISGFAQGRWIGSFGLLQLLARGGSFRQVLFEQFGAIGRAGGYVTQLFYHVSLANAAADRGALAVSPVYATWFERQLAAAHSLDTAAMRVYFATMPTIDLREELAAIRCPCLVIGGSHDPIVPPEQSQIIANAIPQAKLAELNGAGHLPFFERPAAFNAALDRFWPLLPIHQG